MERDLGPHAKPAKDQGEPVTFPDYPFMPFVVELYRKYPSERIALDMGELDETTGLRRGRLIAHHPDSTRVFDALNAYGKEHPGAEIRFFSTDMAKL